MRSRMDLLRAGRGLLLLGLSKRWTTGHQLRDVVTGELGQLMVMAGLRGLEQTDDEGAFLLEEEDVLGLLLVHVATEHPERVLVMTCVVWRGRFLVPAPRGGLVHEPGDVVIEERQRLLDLRSHALIPAATPPARHDEALHDEAVRGLDEEHVAHAALVEERSNRPEDLLE